MNWHVPGQCQASRIRMISAMRNIVNAMDAFDGSEIPGRDYEHLMDLGYTHLQDASADLFWAARLQGHHPGPFPTILDAEKDDVA